MCVETLLASGRGCFRYKNALDDGTLMARTGCRDEPICKADVRSRQRILVVDDDPEIRKLLARYIESQGFRVSLAASCRELPSGSPRIRSI